MPHKHTRRRDNDKNNFDLAPTKLAQPLPAFQKSEKTRLKRGQHPHQQPPTSTKRKRNGTSDYKQDDTPRAFARLMEQQAGKKLRSGLDNGESKKAVHKKRKLQEQEGKDRPSKQQQEQEQHSKATATAAAEGEIAEKLKIQPGEGLADFAARVNQTLPMAGLARKGASTGERVTKTEKRLQKMYAEWRIADAKRREKWDEARELQEEADDEKSTEVGGQAVKFEFLGKKGKGKGKGKRERMVGEEADDEEDPWAVLKTRREERKGLHDVVQAPPVIKVVPKEIFKVKNGARVEVSNVPGKSGSLARREELGEARREVIERYRSLMKGGGKKD